MHCHDFFKMYIHYGGGKAYCVGKDIYQLKPNHLMIFPPFNLHGILDRQVLDDYERAYLYISPYTGRFIESKCKDGMDITRQALDYQETELAAALWFHGKFFH